MSHGFPIRQGDLLPVLSGRVSYLDDQRTRRPFSFAGWTDFTFTAVGTTKTITGAAIAQGDRLTYRWSGTDTDTPGTYQATFRGLDPDGRLQTFPTEGHLTIKIIPT